MRFGTRPGLLVAAVLLVSACAGDSREASTVPTFSEPPATGATEETDEGPPVSPSPTGPTTTGPVDPENLDSTVVALLSDTSVGGTVDRRPTLLDSRAALREFTAQFPSRAFARDVRAAVLEAQPPPGHEVVAAVVAVGCEVPSGVELVLPRDRLRVRTEAPAGPDVQCLAPMTTVAVFTVESGAVDALRHNGAA